jgi:integrase
MPRPGRPQKPYETTWGEIVAGLTRCADGRWRIVETEKRFTEPDERRAVARFKKWARTRAQDSVLISVSSTSFPDGMTFREAWEDSGAELIPAYGDDPARLELELPENVLWPWLREKLINDPGYVAEAVAIPELTSLARFELPKASIRVSDVIASYEKHSPATAKAKQEAMVKFHDLVKFAGAKTLDDLTDEKLLAYREKVVSNPALASSGTISAYFNRIRSVIRIAGRGLDAAQIDVAVARCKAKLYPPKNNVEDDPHPISRKNFQRLLDGVEKTNIPVVWRAMLLLGLNCALYMEDLCDMKWKHLKLDEGVYIARRNKRGRCLRAAVLWPETREAIRALPGGGSAYVFVSNRGTRYNKNTKINDFKDFTTKLGVSGVTFSHLRDGAYSAACNAKNVKDRFAELLAGHKTGMKDKYVIRNPRVVLPATRAVYRRYFGVRGKSTSAPCPQGGAVATLPPESSISADGQVSETLSEKEIGRP